MKWFKHDSDASMDAKLQEVLLDYGLEGYGLYWYCLELIAVNVDKNNLNFELEHDARIIARNTGSTHQKIVEMMSRFSDLGLFENTQGVITCLKMMSRTDEYTHKILASKNKELSIVGTVSGQNRILSELIEEKRTEENRTDKTDSTPDDSSESKNPTLAGSICRDLNEMGFTGINPSNPKFLAVLESGGTHAEFIDKAKVISKDKKNFNYLIAAVIGERKNSGDVPSAKAKKKTKEEKWG